MALPKGKISKARKHSRRANWKLTLPAIVDCPQCHKKMLAHPNTWAERAVHWLKDRLRGSDGRSLRRETGETK